MGRLDDAAKHKVVELRKAGLSFRKIKAVLELENIKVSAQAIYLFLREFQGRPPGRVRRVEIGSTSSAQVQGRGIGFQESWSGVHLQNLIRESSQQPQHSGFIAKSTSPSTSKPPGSIGICRSDRSQEQGNEEENDIQIVSVTSLAQNTQSGPQPSVTTTARSLASSTGAINAAIMRRRVSPSPATSSMLAARKRILDKALLHRIKSSQQVTSLLRRDQTSVQSGNLRTTAPQPSNTSYSNERTVMESHLERLGTSAGRYSIQRPSLSLHLPPRVGIRLPSQPAPMATSVAGSSILRLPNPLSSHAANHNEGNSSPQQNVQDSRVRGLLQDQMQNLSSEVKSLGVAVKMLVEQQCNLEREQVQQTNIQKQILSTLQSMSSKLGCYSTVQQQHSKTPSPAATKSTSFNQDTFNCNQGTYTECSQTQQSFTSLDALETVETFKLPELSPTSMNGFAGCSGAESLPLIHSPSQRQTYAALYPQQNSQAHMSGFTQNYVSSFSPSNNQTFRGPTKIADFSNSCVVRTLQDCSISTVSVLPSSDSGQDQVNTIKVEGP